MLRSLALVAALSSCAITQRHVFKRCPTLPAQFVDFAASGVLIGLSVFAWNSGQEIRTLEYVTGGMAIALSSNLSECRRVP